MNASVLALVQLTVQLRETDATFGQNKIPQCNGGAERWALWKLQEIGRSDREEIEEEGTTELCLQGKQELDWVMVPAKAKHSLRYWETNSQELAITGAQSSHFLPTGQSLCTDAALL